MTDPTHLGKWQESVVAVRPADDTPPHVGSTGVVTRRVNQREMTMTSRVEAMDPPRSFRAHVIDGPIRPRVGTTIEPLDNGARVTIALDFETHGMGKVRTPLVVRPNARKEMPRNEQRLKEILERGM